MESVKYYHVSDSGLVEGVALGRTTVVLVSDFSRVSAENEALQLMLNNRDDLDDQLTGLEQRRYAEQQAREAAERRVEVLEGLLAVRDDLLQSVSCLGVFGLLHEDLKNRIKACVRESQSARLRSALNPTAEAESHDH